MSETMQVEERHEGGRRHEGRRPVSLMVVLILMFVLPALAAEQRKLGTIGPPPRKSPQRQASGEGIPPLPLPAVPLRRSEPKSEPDAPLFAARLMYGTYQDYMPNPGDLDNLMKHVRANLDVWYGQQMISAEEIIAIYAQGKSCDIPMLYVTGYHPFELTGKQRGALREYLLDGGTIVADAALGSAAFSESFRAEMAKMFPRRKFGPLPQDHAVRRSYFKAFSVKYFTVARGTGSQVEGPPVLEGLNLAARTAVIFSPYDLTCGWDGFFAPPAEARVPGASRTKAMVPHDAVRMGINIVAYVAAERRFGKAQAATRTIIGNQPRRRAALHIALVRHHGDWNADPNSLHQLIRLAAQRTSVPVEYELRPVDPNIEQLADTPVVILTGLDEPQFSDNQVEALRRHLQAGGFLFINNTSGYSRFDREARRLIERIMPDRPLEAVPGDHPLLSGLYRIESMHDAATGKERPAELEAVTVDERAAIVYSKNDTLAMLKGIHDPYANAYDAESARQLSLNILTYALRR